MPHPLAASHSKLPTTHRLASALARIKMRQIEAQFELQLVIIRFHVGAQPDECEDELMANAENAFIVLSPGAIDL